MKVRNPLEILQELEIRSIGLAQKHLTKREMRKLKTLSFELTRSLYLKRNHLL